MWIAHRPSDPAGARTARTIRSDGARKRRALERSFGARDDGATAAENAEVRAALRGSEPREAEGALVLARRRGVLTVVDFACSARQLDRDGGRAVLLALAEAAARAGDPDLHVPAWSEGEGSAAASEPGGGGEEATVSAEPARGPQSSPPPRGPGLEGGVVLPLHVAARAGLLEEGGWERVDDKGWCFRAVPGNSTVMGHADIRRRVPRPKTLSDGTAGAGGADDETDRSAVMAALRAASAAADGETPGASGHVFWPLDSF
jgi:hypothetical protein